MASNVTYLLCDMPASKIQRFIMLKFCQFWEKCLQSILLMERQTCLLSFADFKALSWKIFCLTRFTSFQKTKIEFRPQNMLFYHFRRFVYIFPYFHTEDVQGKLKIANNYIKTLFECNARNWKICLSPRSIRQYFRK